MVYYQQARRERKQTVMVSRVIIGLATLIGGVSLLALSAHAASYGGGSVTGYGAEAPIDNGTIVQLTGGKDAKQVKVATQKELKNMFGVTVDRNQLPITLSSEALKNETFVAVSGTYNVLVNTQGGTISSGDYVTLSAIDGIAMKAGTDEETVFGRAVAPFDGKGVTLGTMELKDTTGKPNKTVTIGSIPVTIDIKRNPNEKSTRVDVPQFLQRIGQQIAEKEVNPIRIYLSVGITVISLVIALVVIYAGIRNSIISIGRNPMSKKSIFRALFEIILTCLLILIVGLFAVYLLLRL